LTTARTGGPDWWCIETRLRETRGAAKFPEMRVIPVVVKIAAPGLTKISCL